MKTKILLVVLFLMLAGIFSYQVTYALFVDTSTSTSNTFTAASEFPITAPITGPLSLVINEVSPVGGTDDDWVELYNPTSSSISLTGWKIQDGGGTDVFPGTISIDPNSYAVIVASGSAAPVPLSALKIELSTSTIGGAGGLAQAGEVIRLLTNTDNIHDQMSYGSNVSVFNIATPSASQSVRRIPNGVDTDTAGDWSNGASSIGVAN